MSLVAILRALAEGFANAAAAAEAQESDTAAPAKGGRKKAAAATEPAQPAAAPAPVASAPAPQPAPSPAAPTLSKEKLNKAVLDVAGKDRQAAVDILAKYGATSTATLPLDKYQAVFDDFEEKLAAIDAAAARQSLV